MATETQPRKKSRKSTESAIAETPEKKSSPKVAKSSSKKRKADAGDDEPTPKGNDTFTEGQDVGTIPEVAETSKTSAKDDRRRSKRIGNGPSKGGEGSGVLYIGRLPFGFFEHEMRSYFGQFGPIANLRMSRNKKTGASRHYAFIEFEEASTAEIVAKTMDNYLLFGHILKCKVIPPAQVHESLFKGANRRFKIIPWNKMAGRELEKPQTESAWNERNTKEQARRQSRAKKLKAMGYEFTGPDLKQAAAIEAPAAAAAAAAAVEEDETKTIESAPVEDEVAQALEAAKLEAVAEPDATAAPVSKPKKKKRSSNGVESVVKAKKVKA